jgi:LysM repeat protein
MIKTILYILLSVLASSGISFAAFEDLGVGSRPVGMGNAFTALADDAHAPYYNPAGLGQIDKSEFTSSYNRHLLGMDDESNLSSSFIGYVQPLGKKYGSLGVNWLNLTLLGDYQENTFLISYGKEIKNRWNIGLNIKWLSIGYGEDQYTAIDPVFDYGNRKSVNNFSSDFGILYVPSHHIQFALSLQDINRPEMGLMDSSRLPMGIKIGIAHKSPLLNLALDLFRRDRDMKLYSGVEKRFFNSYDMRGGLALGNNQYRNLFIGIGYESLSFRIDYAFAYPLSGITETYGSHRLSLTLFSGSLMQKRVSDETKIKQLEKGKAVKDDEIQRLKKDLEQTKSKNKNLYKKINEIKRKSLLPRTKQKRELDIPKEVPNIHKVKQGETLQSIALYYYGDSDKWTQIYDVNSENITKGVLVPGTTLIIPRKGVKNETNNIHE